MDEPKNCLLNDCYGLGQTAVCCMYCEEKDYCREKWCNRCDNNGCPYLISGDFKKGFK